MSRNEYRTKNEAMKPETIVRKKGWIHRNPRLFVGTLSALTVVSILSKPIYDLFHPISTEDFEREMKNYVPLHVRAKQEQERRKQ